MRRPSVNRGPGLKQLQPLLSNDSPNAEAVSPIPGDKGMAARDDHKHPRISSATIGVLGSNGEATIVFTRTFPVIPAVACLLFESAESQPVIFKVKTWTRDAQLNYTGCVIKGYRSATLPPMGGVALVAGVVAALGNFNVFSGNASGAQFCCLAILPSA